jgi:hypothetical protein
VHTYTTYRRLLADNPEEIATIRKVESQFDRRDLERNLSHNLAGLGYAFAVVSCLFLSTGCSTPYQPDGLGGGYSDNRIDSTTESVEFRGNGYTSKRKVEMYLLYRCAEVTRDAGYDYFIALNPSTEARQGSFSTPGSFSSTTSFLKGAAFTHASYFPGQTITFTSYGATTLIRMGRGPKPVENLGAFNAREVIEYMGPQIHETSEEAEGVQNTIPTTRASATSSGPAKGPPSYKGVYSGVLDLDHDPDNP